MESLENTNEEKIDKNIGLTATESHGEILTKDIPGKQYDINDQAYSQSSKHDFYKTTSNFHHKDEGKIDLDQPEQ